MMLDHFFLLKIVYQSLHESNHLLSKLLYVINPETLFDCLSVGLMYLTVMSSEGLLALKAHERLTNKSTPLQ